jgi:preprotein translocase subunit SecE
MINPFEFLQQVRAEGSKVTWPSRRETLITTAMVFVFAIIASLFFLLTDQVIRLIMSTLLNFLR